MGRVLQGNTVATSGGGNGTGAGLATFTAKAGATVSQNDLLLLGYDGQVSPAKVTDYIASPGSVGSSGTQTGFGTGAYLRHSAAPGDDGSFFVAAVATGNGAVLSLRLYKFTATGTQTIPSALIDATNAEALNVQTFRLSNGNVAVAYFMPGNGYRFAIYDQNLTPVVTSTLIENSVTPFGQSTSAIALSGGGFAVCYQQAANTALQRFAIYDNSGTTVLAPTTIQTWSGGSGSTTVTMSQLSDSNVAIACNSTFTTTKGLFYGIRSATGTQVIALANLDSSTTGTSWLELCAAPGYFAIAQSYASTKAFIFNNAGALQGGSFVSTAGALTALPALKLVTDGNLFYLLYEGGGTTKFAAKLPFTGTSYVSFPTVGSSVSAGTVIDATFVRGLIAVVYSTPGGDTAPLYATLQMANFPFVTPGGSWGTAPEPGTGSRYVGLLPRSDFSCIGLGDYAGVSGGLGTTFFAVIKHTPTLVIGVAQNSGATGETIAIATGPGVFAVNHMSGSSPKQMSVSTTPYPSGGKGTLYTNAVVLNGL